GRRHTRCYRDWSSDVCSSDLSIRCTNRPPPSRGHRPRRRACRGHRPSRLSLVAWISRRNATAALVPPELAELLEPRELFRGEDRTIEAHELVVQRSRVAAADSAPQAL